ncbi:MAG: phosphatase PAP2 family protein [Ignavibacteriae bacterium]|nr:MAG: phosphatase PAP2 family protein [Ignavibacteriota bacterium]
MIKIYNKYCVRHLVLITVFIAYFTGNTQSQDVLQDTFIAVGNKPVITNIVKDVKEEGSDVKLFRTINNHHTKFFDKFFNITDKSVLPVSIVLPVTLFTYGRIKNRTYDENTGVLLASSEALNFLVTGGIKYLFKRERPYKTLSNVHYKRTSFADKYSFPSGHTSTSFAISTMLMLRYPKSPQIYVPVYLWSLIVAYGRPYWGMHYPSDLLGGAVIGTLSSVAIFSIRKEIIKLKNSVFNEKDKPDLNTTSGLNSVIAGIYIISLSLNEYLSNDKLNFTLLPEHNSNTLNGVSCFINFNF